MTQINTQPLTVVIGSAPLVDGQGVQKIGYREPLKRGDGRYVGTRALRPVPLFTEGRKSGLAIHFCNEAARRRAGGDIRKAPPNDTVLVPIYAGLNGRLANELRADVRRDRRRSLKQRVKRMIKERLLKPEDKDV